MRDYKKAIPNPLTEAQALEALRYEISCVQSFYPELAELRNTLQELFIISVSAKPNVIDSEDLPKYAFMLFLVCNLLKKIEGV